MPVYNMERFIRFAIDSVIAQSYTNYELIIIDDGSKDGSRQIIEEYIAKYSHDFSIIYHFQQNQGLACARNTGIKISSGEYIALLDPDDVWLPERLSEGVKILNGDSSIGLVHANIIYIDECGEKTGIPTRNASLLSGNIYENILLRLGHISCPTVLFRRSCLDEVGMFDEYLTYLGCEDRDLWLRITQKFKAYYIPKELAYYRRVSGSMSSNADKMFKARTYVVEKNAQGLLRRKAYAAVHLEMGDLYDARQDYKNAYSHYFKSLSCWPFSLSLLLRISKSAVKMLLR